MARNTIAVREIMNKIDVALWDLHDRFDAHEPGNAPNNTGFGRALCKCGTPIDDVWVTPTLETAERLGVSSEPVISWKEVVILERKFVEWAKEHNEWIVR